MNIFRLVLFSMKRIKQIMMRIIYKKTLWATVVAISFLWVLGCVKYPQKDWLMEVTDKKAGGVGWNLKYDYRGRLVQYGDTPISYRFNRVDIGSIQACGSDGKMYSATYRLSDKETISCESYYEQMIDSVQTEICKFTDYEWKEDTLVMTSVYRRAKDGEWLRNTTAWYLYDDENRLMEVFTSCSDDEHEDISCHSYYCYEKNIRNRVNLNMQAYIVDREDWDTFFFFLLNMSGREKTQALPNSIRHCVRHGKATHMSECLYRLNDYCPVFMEIITDEVQVKARYEFKYYN